MSNLVVEKWKPVTNFPDYWISTYGRVKRVYARGRAVDRIIKHKYHGTGYARVNFWKKNVQYTQLVHLLVARTFIGPCPKGKEVNHKDGDKTNPRLENLEYVTRKQNAVHARDMGLTKIGERHYSTKFKNDDVRAIRNRVAFGETHQSVADDLGVQRVTITDICSRKNWRQLD